MVRNRGGLLASTGAIALGFARFASFGRVPEGEGGEGAGDAAVVEEEDFFAGTGAAEEKPGEEKPGEEKPGEAEPAEWMKSFSGEKKDGELSHQEWLAKIGAKDVDDVVGRYRELEKAHRASGKVKVPGEGATEAEIKSYREAIGAPLEATGYEVGLPEGADGFELDTAMLEPMREIALKYHIPAAAFKEMGAALLSGQLAGFQGEIAQHGVDKNAKLKEWGPEAEQGKAEFKRGQQFLGLKVGDIQRIQIGYGVGPTMDLLRLIGQRAGEDFFAGNAGSTERFGVADLASAQTQLNAMIDDKPTAAKLRAKDPVTVKRYNTLTAAVAHFREKAAKAA
jgi:hypothetical protein